MEKDRKEPDSTDASFFDDVPDKTGKPSFRLNISRLSEAKFQMVSGFIQTHYGIKMPQNKKIMLEARLQKRMRTLGFESIDEYCDYVFSPEGVDTELSNMIDVVTTNKTDFFRDKYHFDYLRDTYLPEFYEKFVKNAKERRTFMAWSAGCSTGEEPYTLAMVLNEFASANEGFEYLILATDLCLDVLDKARNAVYREDRIGPIDEGMLKKYFLISKDRTLGQVRIVPELRNRITFRQLNFIENDYGIEGAFDLILCRNVLIYFDRNTQSHVVNMLCRYLQPHGRMIFGPSETLMWVNAPLKSLGSTIYKADFKG